MYCRQSFPEEKQRTVHIQLYCQNKPYTCNICHKKYTAIYALFEHQKRSHTMQIENYECDICSKKFNVKNYLTRHIKNHFTKKKPKTEGELLVCDLCQKQFGHISSLWRHKKTYHSNIKPFKCNVCAKTFTFSHPLKKHMQIHKDIDENYIDKRFQCKHCNRYLRDKFGLISHIRLHTGERPFKCEHCTMDFRERSHLNLHLKSKHEHRFQCDICCSLFSTRITYKKHLKLHKQFECIVCHKTFATLNSVRKHCMNLHSDEQQIECKICFKFFACKEYLKNHLKKHKQNICIKLESGHTKCD